MIWVELPRGTSDDIGTGLKESPGLPKSTIQEQKDLMKQREPVVDEKKMAEPVTKADKKKEVKPEKKLTKEQQKMKDALAKIDKQLKKRVIQPEAAQVGQNTDGYKYGTSDKPLRVSIDDPEYVKYQAMIRAKVVQEWIIPARYSEMPVDTRPKARVIVMINEDGEVLTTEWEQRSGDPGFDASCIRAVQRASPFEIPTEKLKWEAYNEGFLIEFDPRLKP
jgi:TonB family protein